MGWWKGEGILITGAKGIKKARMRSIDNVIKNFWLVQNTNRRTPPATSPSSSPTWIWRERTTFKHLFGMMPIAGRIERKAALRMLLRHLRPCMEHPPELCWDSCGHDLPVAGGPASPLSFWPISLVAPVCSSCVARRLLFTSLEAQEKLLESVKSYTNVRHLRLRELPV